MAHRLRFVATVVATIGLIAATVGTASARTKPAPGGDGDWYVYPASAGCTANNNDCVFTVTKQTTWKDLTAVTSGSTTTCLKDTSYPDLECRGTGIYAGYYFIRVAKGDPWIAYDTGL